MKRRAIPGTELEVSQIGYGCGMFGGSWDNQPIDPDDLSLAPKVLRAAEEIGIDFFDVAASYAYGKAEQVLGQALKQMPGMRERIVLQSKCGIVLPQSMELLDPPPDDPYYLDSSREHIVASAEASLRRLGTDYLDILLLHRPDILMEPDEVAAAFDALHRAGKVRHFGLSNFSPAQCEYLRKALDQPVVTNQLRFGLAHPHLVADGFDFNRVAGKRSAAHHAGTGGALEYFRAQGILIQAWSPMQGTFAGDRWNEDPERTARIVDALGQVAAAYGATPDAIALAWILRHPAGFAPIVGTRNVDRLRSYAAATDIALSRRDWYRLFYAASDSSVYDVHQG